MPISKESFNPTSLTGIVTSLLLFSILIAGFSCGSNTTTNNNDFISFEVNVQRQDLKLYWKNDSGQLFRSIGHLKDWLKRNGQELRFAMNGGMYKPDNAPQGLFIQEQRIVAPLDTTSGTGNFYLKPNGVFYTTIDGKAVVCKTEDFRNDERIAYATQSGPMLLIDGKVHPAFTPGSTNVNIRNGVGILANGHALFAMSKEKVNLYDFASFFKAAGCKNALYLDGLVSRTYLPEKQWMQTDGDFGVIIAVTAKR